MVIYSALSSNKIVHLPNCKFIKKIKNKASFESLAHARKNGYRLCNCCAPISKKYQKESKEIEFFCRTEGLSVRLSDGELIIDTPCHSKWKLITADKSNKLFLYHKNSCTLNNSRPESMIPGYHIQAVREKTILNYLKYILNHDEWRRIHPLATPAVKRTTSQKGTKRWRAEQKKEKSRQKKMQTRHVLDLIDSIQANNYVAG